MVVGIIHSLVHSAAQHITQHNTSLDEECEGIFIVCLPLNSNTILIFYMCDSFFIYIL